MVAVDDPCFKKTEFELRSMCLETMASSFPAM